MRLRIIRKAIDNHSHLAHTVFMIHCICRNINTAKVDAAHACGARNACHVMKHCGTKFNCGQCKDSIQSRLDTLHAIENESVLQAAE